MSTSVRSTALAYVTDLLLKPGGGGSYAVNWHFFRELARQFPTTYCGPIVPRPSRIAQTISRINRRVLRRPGRFVYFSERTLRDNADAVNQSLPPDTSGVVFRSAARWSRFKSSLPYFIYLDATFHTFFYNTFLEQDFQREDLARIFEAEAEFLENARAVFFESHWGMAKAREAYSLKGSHYAAVGRGGVIAPPPADSWDGQSHALVTIAMNFEQKGGDIVLEAYRSLKHRFPDLSWHIIGGRPTADVFTIPGIVYEGILNPDNPLQRLRLERVLSNAFLLLHPTREDTSPLVITEAAYFGCPAISVNAFAIPELIVHGVSGLLLESPSPDSVADAVEQLLSSPLRYRDMRVNARQHALARSQWSRVGDFAGERIRQMLEPR